MSTSEFSWPVGSAQWSVHDQKRAAQMALRYKDRVIVVLHNAGDRRGSPVLTKRKFVCPLDLTGAQFMGVVRRHARVQSTDALFLLCNGKLVCMSDALSTLRDRDGDADGVVHLVCTTENTFG